MSTIPIATRMPHQPPAAAALPSPKRARSRGHGYVPGMFDRLIDRPVLGVARPDQIRGVTIELAASGRSVVLAEQLTSGSGGQRRLLTLEEPYSVFMRLSDGREVWIEVRAVEQAPEEDRAEWEDVGEPTEYPRDIIRLGGGIREVSLEEVREMYPEPVRHSTFSCPDFSPRS